MRTVGADGSLFDVSLLAAVAALQSLRLPQVSQSVRQPVCNSVCLLAY
jgi:exosome complex RNA-binding protein Rrp42 (RNase PH superfamily)